MAFEIPSTRWTHLAVGPAHRAAAPASLDWAGLRARFVAAHELRRLAYPVSAQLPAQGGSFAAEIAAQLGATALLPADPSPGVNPNDLGNRKAALRMDINDDRTLVSADRGMQ